MRRRRDQREKLSDLYGRQVPIFGGPRVPFLEAFPTVEALELTVIEHAYEPVHTTRMTEKAVWPVVDCTNPVCAHGGIRIEPLIREAIHAGKSEINVSSICPGYEGSPKGRRRYRKCLHSFEVAGTIRYRDTPITPTETDT